MKEASFIQWWKCHAICNMNEYFLIHFLPLLRWARYFEVAGEVVESGLSKNPNSNTQVCPSQWNVMYQFGNAHVIHFFSVFNTAKLAWKRLQLKRNLGYNQQQCNQSK